MIIFVDWYPVGATTPLEVRQDVLRSFHHRTDALDEHVY